LNFPQTCQAIIPDSQCPYVRSSAAPHLFFFQAEDGIRDFHVTGVQTCALPISKQPIWAMSTVSAAWRRYVLLPAMFGPVRRMIRSEERRVGKECRSRCWAEQHIKRRQCEMWRDERARGHFITPACGPRPQTDPY